MSLPFLTVVEAAAQLARGELSPVDLLTATLAQIDRLEGQLNAFITLLADAALDQARQAAADSGSDPARPLHGIPLAVKDNIATAGIRTTGGSTILADHIPPEDAPAWARLRQAGGILVGKTNLHEFGMGPTNLNPHYGPTRNPWDPARVPGGSSGGSAAAVAAGMAMAALGTDAGGSVRIPAALCGVVGMKPTFGRVSKHGVFPLAWTLDHVGPLTRTVEDNALLLNALAGHDPRDPYSVARDPEDFSRDLRSGARGGAVGVPVGFYFERLEDEVGARVAEAAEVFRDLGARVREVEVPHLQETLDAQRLVLAAEAYAVHEERVAKEPGKFDEEVRERVRAGAKPKAYEYANAQRAKLRSMRAFSRAFGEVDVLLTPTVPIPATKIGQREVVVGGEAVPVRAELNRLTGPTNLNGLPSLSVPCGFTASGLPVGIQLIGRPFGEATLYRYGHAFERATH